MTDPDSTSSAWPARSRPIPIKPGGSSSSSHIKRSRSPSPTRHDFTDALKFQAMDLSSSPTKFQHSAFFSAFSTSPPDLRASLLRALLDDHCTPAELEFIQRHLGGSSSGGSFNSGGDLSPTRFLAPIHPEYPMTQFNHPSHFNHTSNTTNEQQLQWPLPQTHYAATTTAKTHLGSDPFTYLPDETLITILNHVHGVDASSLAIAARVCRRWGVLIRDNHLWRSLCRVRRFEPLHRRSLGEAPGWSGVMEVEEEGESFSSGHDRERPRSVLGMERSRRGDDVVDGSSEEVMLGVSLDSARGLSSMNQHHVKDLAPWKRVYRQNHLTLSNWQKGIYRVQPLNVSRTHMRRGTLCLHFDENWMVNVALGHDGYVWNVKTGKLHMRLSGHRGVISTVKICDNRIVTGGVDHILRVWDLKTRECVQVLEGHEGEIVQVDYDGDTLASGSEDHTLKIWNMNDGSNTKTLTGHTGAVCCLQYTRNSIVSGSIDATLKLWDPNTGECKATLTGHRGHVYCLHVHKQRLVSGSADTTIRQWSLDEPSSPVARKVLRGHTSAVVCIQSDDAKIVSGSGDKTVRVWDVAKGVALYVMEWHSAGIWNLRLFRNKLVTSAFDEKLVEWDFTHDD